MKTIQFKTNINCGNCIKAVEPRLSKLSALNKWNVDTANPDKILTIESEADVTEEVMAAVKKAGFEIEKL